MNPLKKTIHRCLMEARRKGKSLQQAGYAYRYVTIYRAVPAKTTEFKSMDYVTRSKRWAVEHADHVAAVEEEPAVVLKAIVKATEVFEADNPGEYFYDGPTVKGKVVYTKKPLGEAIPAGDCFRFAATYPVEHSKGMFEKGTVVHGMCINPDPGPGERDRFEHAWVEYQGKVYDWQTIRLYGMQPTPIKAFYGYWKPYDLKKYTPAKALGNAIAKKHYGPW